MLPPDYRPLPVVLSGPTCRLVWLPCAQEFFLLLLFLSLSNAIENVSGGALGDKINPFNIATIGNLRALTPSYGVMEFVIGFFCVRFMYQMRSFLASEARRIDDAHLTSADFCVQVHLRACRRLAQ